MIRRLLFCVMAVALWAPPASAQNVRVQLKVSADDELKGPLQAYLEDGLRRVPTVSVAGGADGVNFTISVIAIKVVTRSSKDMGLAVSVLITAPYTAKIKKFAETQLSPELGGQLSLASAGAVEPLAHWIETASVGQLQQVSQSIIQAFVKDVLTAEQKAALHEPSQLDARAPPHRSP